MNTGSGPDLEKSMGSFVDVHDVALANIPAVEKKAARGESILIARISQTPTESPGRLLTPPSAPSTWKVMS